MKKTLIFVLLVLLPLAAAAQDNTRNYVVSTTYKVPYNPPPNTSLPVSDDDKTVNITYYDGLGRPIQQIAHKQSASGFDIITHMDYDAFGRKTRDYLPYVRKNPSLGFDGSAASSQASFYASPDPDVTGTEYFEATTNPYSETFFEKSPLGTVLKKAAPGNDWLGSATGDSDHSVRFIRQANGPGEALKFMATTSWIATDGLYLPALVAGGTYGPGQLYKAITRDENWQASDGHNHTTEEFTNKNGQAVLKRSYCGNVPLDTYYVYDIYDKLTYILPPLLDAAGTIDATKLNGTCYQYRYDQRNRMVEKKLPGKQWEYMVYDKLDRVVATGPAYDPFGSGSQGWIITRYDAFSRVAYTGWVPETEVFNTATRRLFAAPYADPKVLMNEAKTTSATMLDDIGVFYTNAVHGYTGLKLLSVNYYDNYVFPNPPPSFPITIFGAAALASPKGLQTGGFIRALNDPSQQDGESSYTLYDSRSRPIRSYSTHYLGGYHRIETEYAFTGLAVKTVTTHTPNNTEDPITVTEDFEYAPNQQLIKTIHKVNGADAELLSLNRYSELGQLVSKKCGGPDTSGDQYLQKADYRYNARGWLKGINDISSLSDPDGPADLFAFAINYNTTSVETPGTIPLFNGNISETQWRTANDNVHRGYSYAYDALNRLRKAEYFVGTGPNEYEVRNSYDESMDYDPNGNITSMRRTGDLDDATEQVEIDDLTYGYDPDIPNRLLSVTDDTLKTSGFKDGNTGGNDFFYDANGNLIEDRNKEIEQITYNHLNLPVHIAFAHNNSIDYLYDAAGQKLNKRVTDSSGVRLTRYINGFQYHNGALQFFPTSEGYVKNTVVGDVTVYSYAYNYTDHLGNVRLTYGYDPLEEQVKIMEENNYYPFGLRHRNYNMDYKTYYYQYERFGISPVDEAIAGRYNYKYNGKEWQDELGLNMTAMDFRQYDNALGRFNSIDALSEWAYDQTPYRFAFNNPNYWNDPSGLSEIGMENNDIKGWVNNGKDVFWDPKVNNQGDIDRLYNGKGYNYVPNGTEIDGVRYDDNGEKMNMLDEVVVEGKGKSSSSNSNNPDFSPWGPTLILLGQPLDFLKPVGALESSVGSSIASRTLSKLIPYNSPLLKQTTRKVVAKIVGKQIAKRTGTAVVGRFLGRLVPYVGWTMFAKDVWDNRDFLKGTISAGAADYYEMQEKALNGGVDENGVPLPIVCFTKGTLIYGKEKFIPIEDINIGDVIYSFNIEENKLEFSTVTKTLNRITDGIFEIVVDDEIINVTAEHPIYVDERGWVKVKDLRKGDLLKSSNGKIEIKSIRQIAKKTTVYNMEVDGNHDYFVTNSKILVHNKNIREMENKEPHSKTKK